MRRSLTLAAVLLTAVVAWAGPSRAAGPRLTSLTASLHPAANLVPVRPPKKCRKGFYRCHGTCIADRFLCAIK